MTKTIVGLYDDLSKVRSVVEELVAKGVAQDDISLMLGDPDQQYTTGLETIETSKSEAAEGAAVGAVGGAMLGGLGGILLGLGALAIPGLGPVIAAGPIVAGLLGAGLGAATGGLVGSLVGLGIPEEEAVYYTEGVRRGGLLVVVNADEHQVDDVADIMRRHNPINLEERIETWQREGWAGYDPEVDYYSLPSYAGDYRQHYNTHFMHTNRPYAHYKPAYQYGHNLAMAERYDGWEWTEIEPEARRQWEASNAKGTWEEFKEAVKYGWESMIDWFDFDSYEDDYHYHYHSRYANTGHPYEYYLPAYHFGHLLARDENYMGQDWDELESVARQQWETQHQVEGPWEDFKDSVKYAWQRATSWFDYDSYEDDYGRHYNSYYASTGQPYAYYEPAYYLGYLLAQDERYHNWDWNRIEPEARRYWETRYHGMGSWKDFKDGVQHGWRQASAQPDLQPW
jgi:hypothetical protein